MRKNVVVMVMLIICSFLLSVLFGCTEHSNTDENKDNIMQDPEEEIINGSVSYAGPELDNIEELKNMLAFISCFTNFEWVDIGRYLMTTLHSVLQMAQVT